MKDAMTWHMDKVRELQRECDACRAQRDKLTEALRGVVERIGRFPAFRFMLDEAVEVLAELEEE